MNVIYPGSILRKIQSFSSITLNNMGIGEINTCLSVFPYILGACIFFANSLLTLPIIFVPLTLIFLYFYGYVGLIVPLACIFFQILMIFISKVIAYLSQKWNNQTTLMNDKINQLMGGMVHVKLNGWEGILQDRILRNNKACSFIWFIKNSMYFVLIIVSTMVPSIIIFMMMNAIKWRTGDLTLPETFFLISLISILNYPLRLMTTGLNLMRDGIAASNVLNKIMNFYDDESPICQDSNLPRGTLKIEGLTASWMDPKSHKIFKPQEDFENINIFENLSFNFEAGKLYGIIGEVGSGKSSLLYACLSELKIKSGKISLNGKLAFVPQEAFLINDTFRNNIVFYSEYDQERYAETIVKCGLVEDLKNFKSGDMTEIGEKGVNLSGGQKQRISLARAMYCNAKICLIDDALSALDAEVGQFIFEQVLTGDMKDKTRLLITHASHLLDQMDEVLLFEEGKIVQSGKYEQVSKTKEYKRYNESKKKEAEKEEESAIENDSQPKILSSSVNLLPNATLGNSDIFGSQFINSTSKIPIEITDGVITPYKILQHKNSMNYFISNSTNTNKKIEDPTKKIEETKENNIEEKISKFRQELEIKSKNKNSNIEEGRITNEESEDTRLPGMGVLLRFMHYYNYFLFGFNVLIMMAAQFTLVVLIWLFGQWATSELGTDFPYPLVVAGLILLALFFFISFSVLNSFGVRRASDQIFENLLRIMLKKPMQFYDSTPIGQVIARLVNDRISLINEVGQTVMFVTFAIVQLFVILLITVINSPILIVLFIILFFLFTSIIRKSILVSIGIRKIINIKNAPVISKITEAFKGAILLKAYGKKDSVSYELEKRNNELIKAKVHEGYSIQQMSLKSESIGCLVVFFSLLSFTLFKIFEVPYFVEADRVALSVNQLMIFAFWFTYNIFHIDNMFKGMTACERIFEWSDNKLQEADWLKKGDNTDPSGNWVTEGAIKLDRFSVRYREGLPLVLKNLSFEIKPREKIGVVGRTGSGKSTLILAFKRILEPASESLERKGQIMVDGHDLHAMGLWPCRRSMVLIPQDPYLMEATLRFNIDPFDEYSDEEVLSVLSRTSIIQSLSKSIREKAETKESNNTNAQKRSQLAIIQKNDPSQPFKSQKRGVKNSQNNSRNQAILNFQIKSGGTNLSQGQKQLVCIARAIVQKPKILLMDEATANIDKKTEQVIQDLIETDLSNSTVITIAHRLETIIKYDRIFFLKNGGLIEDGEPHRLMKKGEGEDRYFRDLVMEGGESYFQRMLELAKKEAE